MQVSLNCKVLVIRNYFIISAMSNLASSVWRCARLLTMTVKTDALTIRRVRSNVRVNSLIACTTVPVKTDARRDVPVVNRHFSGQTSVASQIRIKTISSARIEIEAKCWQVISKCL